MGADIQADLLGTADGLVEEFGSERVRNVPVSEAAVIGAAVGAAMTGLRPIVDMIVSSFLWEAMDQLISQAAKSRYMFGGQARVPLVVRAGLMYGNADGAQHADRPYPTFMNMPGLKVIAPSTPIDVKGLLKAAIRDDDPVICFEDMTLWRTKGARATARQHRASGLVPDDEDFIIPLASADVKHEGNDVTLVAIAGAVPHALAAADSLAEEGISVEVVDPRTLVPMDRETIVDSVAKTGRLVVADPAHRTCSAASEIAATVAEEAFGSLRAPIRRVTMPDVHAPFSPALEPQLYPDVQKITTAIRDTLAYV